MSGIQSTINILNNLSATAAPGVVDDTSSGYSVNSVWIDQTNKIAWTCVDAAAGAAAWVSGDPTKDNLSAGVDPAATDDSSAGYAIGSTWVNVTAKTAFTCVDATVGVAVWSAGGGGGSTSVYHATGDGVKTVFTDADFTPAGFFYKTASNALLIFIDGVYQQTSAYGETTSTSITFTAAVPSGSIVEARVSTGTPLKNGDIRIGYTGTGDGVQTAFTVADFAPTGFAYTVGNNSIDVYVGAVFQDPSSYTETNASTITFTTAPPSGAQVYVNVQATLAMVDALPASEKGVPSGVATLDSSGNLVETTGLVVYAVAGTFAQQQSFADTTLTDGATIAWDVLTNQVTKVTINGARTMAAPINQVANTFYSIAVIQGAGGDTLAWNAAFKFPNGIAPSLSTLITERDEFTFKSDGTNLHMVGSSINV